jgi:flagellar hook-associated protein 3 FlgL
MTIDRVGTFANTQLLLNQMQRAELALQTSSRQVASGKRSDTYSGYGDKTAVMEAARSTAAHADAHYAAALQASTRLDLQDSQLTQLSNLAGQVRQMLTTAVANQDGTALMDQLQGLFDQAVEILNAKDGSGYIYGGDNNQTPPVTATSLSNLAALPAISGAFDNGFIKASMRIGDNQVVQVGLLASDLGTDLMSLFQQVAQFDAGAGGPFNNGTTTAAQQSFLESTIATASDVAAGVNAQAAANGIRYKSVQSSMDQLKTTTNVYKNFVSSIEDVDVSEALSQLNQNQIALQASFQMSSKLNQLTLLDFLPS